MKKLNSIIRSLQSNLTFRNGIIFAFFSFLNSGVNFFLLFIIAKFISPEGYGKLNIFTTTIMIGAMLVSLNSIGVISVNFFKLSIEKLRETISGIFTISTVVVVFLSILIYSLGPLIETWIHLESKFIIIALLICYFQVYYLINLDLLRIKEKAISYGITSFIFVVLNFATTIYLVLCADMDWAGRAYSQLFSSFVFFIISIYCITKNGFIYLGLAKKSILKDIFSFSLPLFPHNISPWIRQGLDRYIIGISHNMISVGIFSFAYNFANIIATLGLAFNATYSVYIYKNLSNECPEVREKLKKQTLIMICMYSIITVLVITTSYFFIPYIFPEYVESIDYLLPLCLATYFQCIYLLFVNFIFFFKKTKILMNITLSVSVFHAVGSLILTPYSVSLTAYISLISSVIIAVAVYLYSRKLFKVI